PAGSQSYGSSPFLFNAPGQTFIATLWALNGTVVGTADANNLQQITVNGTGPFTATSSGLFAGIWTPPSLPAPIPNAGLETDRPTFQVRVWDTKGGTINTWQDALSRYAGGGYALGYSDLFTVNYPLGGTQSPPNVALNMQGLQSVSVM